MAPEKATRVFISYSHDSDEHCERIRALAEQLRAAGIDACSDQDRPGPEEGWPHWTEQQLAGADFILVVCTRGYAERFDESKGTGVGWEAKLIRQELFDMGRNRRFIPVLFDQDPVFVVPLVLRPYQRYRLPGEFKSLLRHLTRKAKIELAPVAPPVRSEDSDDPRIQSRARATVAFMAVAGILYVLSNAQDWLTKLKPPRTPPCGQAIHPDSEQWPHFLGFCKGVPEGKCETRIGSTIVLTGACKREKMQGEWSAFYENGAQRWSGRAERDQMDGLWSFWDRDNHRSDITFARGMGFYGTRWEFLDGEWRSCKEVFGFGKTQSWKCFDSQGMPYSQGRVEQGKPDGPWTWTCSAGSKSLTYANGTVVAVTLLDADGGLLFEWPGKKPVPGDLRTAFEIASSRARCQNGLNPFPKL